MGVCINYPYPTMEISLVPIKAPVFHWVVVKIMVSFGTLNIRCRIIIRIQKGTEFLTTTHVIPKNLGRAQASKEGRCCSERQTLEPP